MTVRALVFDVFGTLVDWRTSVAVQLDIFARERGIVCDWYAFADAWRGEYVPSMDRVRRGESPWKNLDALHRESFDRLAERFGLPQLTPAERDWASKRWHVLEPWPEVPVALARLHPRFVLATLSNGNVSLLVDLARHAKLRFDTILSAEIFRHYKPDPQTYLGAAELLGCAPAEVMLVAAHEGDLRAAASHGLRTGYVARPDEHGPHEGEDPALPAGFDLAARDLEALAERLLTSS